MQELPIDANPMLAAVLNFKEWHHCPLKEKTIELQDWLLSTDGGRFVILNHTGPKSVKKILFESGTDAALYQLTWC